MINKFQQGGKQDAIMQFVLGLALVLLADPQQVVQIAQQNPNALETAVQVYLQTQDMGQAALAFQQTLQRKTQAAKHGAKLQYLKSLKRQCAEDEELVYYKKGGSVDCDCVKKHETGNKVEKKESVIDKFKSTIKASTGAELAEKKTTITKNYNPPKKRKKLLDLASKDSVEINSFEGNDELEAIRPGTYKPNPKHNPNNPSSRTHIWVPDRTKEPYNKKVKKNCGGSKLKLIKKGDKVCPKCGKIHSAGTGCKAVDIFKHKNGK